LLDPPIHPNPTLARAHTLTLDVGLGLKFPDYDPSNDIKEAKASFEPLIKQAQELAAHSQKRLKEIEQELKQIRIEKVRHPRSFCHNYDQTPI
jgi:hypothetical protein